MTPEEMRRLVDGARCMTDRDTRHEFSIGSYWNVVEELAEALSSCLAQLETLEYQAFRMELDPPSEWECRHGKSLHKGCPHCKKAWRERKTK